jgi:uncharacterized RDD family membrane protein YckC
MEQTAPQHNPYASPTAVVADAPVASGDLAERGTRLAAAIVDSITVMIFYIPVIVVASSTSAKGNDANWAFALAGFAILAVLATNAVMLHRRGQTIGKRLLGIKVVRSDGSRAGLGRIVALRLLPVTLLGMIPLVGPVLGLLDAMLIFRDSRRCLHDQFADTIVVRA